MFGTQRGMNRRRFLEGLALGGASLPHLFAPRVKAQGRSEPAPWAPPPTLSNPNILVILVDQLRLPCWLDSDQATLVNQQILPNIVGRIGACAFNFQQFYVAATICTASRGTFLTGLYAPQTACYADTMQTATIAPLLPQFPTWGRGLPAVQPAYANNMWWFGKWHLSDCITSTPLRPYGFNTRTYPGGPAQNPSPDGSANEGTDGGAFGSAYWACDADIANDFVGWINTHAPATPWCATVSFINPHDISRGPGWLDCPSVPPSGVGKQNVYFPPPPFPPASGAPGIYESPPSSWNYEDLTVVTNKPGAQYAFQQNLALQYGAVTDWTTFLNWYYWLQNYVDQQVGAVLDALEASPYASNTIVIFTSDHGEHGGSHGLHDKGSSAYEEAIRVPFYVRFPGQSRSATLNQMCSSVDFFGLICDLGAGGTGQWRFTYPDLATRQSMWSFLYYNAPETRIAPSLFAPYVLHTCDQTNVLNGYPNGHLVALRTKYSPYSVHYPGGKLGLYSAWAKGTLVPGGSLPDPEFYDYNPATSNNTAEMGNDYYSNDPKTKNAISKYLAALGGWTPFPTGLIGEELYRPLFGTGTDGNPLWQAQATAQLNYIRYLWG